MSGDVVLVIVVATALAFDFTNGFHDTANAIATSISTRAMSPRFAVAMSAVLNFVGAFISLAVAATVAKGIVQADAITTTVVFAGLIGAITWNLATWWFGLPSSSSHALIGGVVGAAFVADGASVIEGDGIVEKVIVPALLAPVLAFTRRRLRDPRRLPDRRAPAPGPVNRGYRFGQLVSGALFSLAHGTNDAQKTMGIITLALIANGNISSTSFHVPTWVVVSSATRDRARHLRRRLAHHPHDGQPHHQDGPGAGLLGLGRGRRGRPDRHAPRLPAVDDARHLGRRHGRRRGQAPLRRALGRRRQHRGGLGADAPGRGAHRRRSPTA